MKCAWPLLVGLLFVAVAPAAADEPASPELKILDHFAGTWDLALEVNPSGSSGKGTQTRGTTTARWILDGQFLQQTSTLQPGGDIPALEVMTLMTYDREAKVYRTWSYVSNGTRTESEGSWDAASRTFTRTSVDTAGVRTTFTSSFADEGTEKWTVAITDAQGRKVAEIVGSNVRRK